MNDNSGSEGETGKLTAGSETHDAIGELRLEETAGGGEASELMVNSVGGERCAVAYRNMGCILYVAT